MIPGPPSYKQPLNLISQILLGEFVRANKQKANVIGYIEIINNTRGGIVMFIQAKKGNASDGGQKIQMLK